MKISIYNGKSDKLKAKLVSKDASEEFQARNGLKKPGRQSN